MDKDTQIVMLETQIRMMEHTTSVLNMIVEGLESQLDLAKNELVELKARLEELEWNREV